MARLTRAEQQARTRAAVVRAATEEFAEHGYTGAKIDRIADRAELTRGAVYSNFPGKRALYLAVLTELVDAARAADAAEPPSDPGAALGAFARVWLERLPLAADSAEQGRLQLRSLTDAADDAVRSTLAQATRLQALLLGLALESVRPPRARRRRRVKQAELALTLLTGAAHLAEIAPGFGDPFAVVEACTALAAAEPDDGWDPPHLAYATPARPERRPVPTEPGEDLLTGRPVRLDADGVVAVLGTGRLSAAEEAVRAAPRGDQVTVVLATRDPDERGRLVRLLLADLIGCLRRVFPPDSWSGPRLLVDEDGRIAEALGVPEAGDDTEVAVRVAGGVIVSRAEGRGAGHSAAAANVAG
ncbi:TetR/AcrR family transcriptional regulator [Microlunatus parietis]|uniref:AcrR family transcriptional regulator n=1 Tax=Microlunatus parietis TaxID=682979 RepID=A0A7Y9LEN1_9ACTN|nr:TetR/AcrR family transcriptional regulator [Microlunatus parietis]NYE74023.1 AcrR family transcriptional regulator [Microlunatus parietis]